MSDGVGMGRTVQVLLAVLAVLLAGTAARAAPAAVGTFRLSTLSTMLADEGYGEWGYAALVEVDGRRVLFDTGANPDVVLHNAQAMHIDLSGVEDVVISHFHGDHTGGLLTLRRYYMQRNPRALSRVHVGAGIMQMRYGPQGQPFNAFAAQRKEYEATGGTVIEHDKPAEIVSGIWLTGPVARLHDERNYTSLEGKPNYLDAANTVVDTVAEDSSLVVETHDGPVIVTGCGHAGIMNIAEAARALTGDARLLAVVGGVHLFGASDAVLRATAWRLKGLRYFLAGHCTGIEATFRLRQLLGLDPRTAVVEAVGSRFEWDDGRAEGQRGGIVAGEIAGWRGS